MDYYKELFSSSNPTEFFENLEAVQSKVTPSMNHKLTMDFFASEVSLALKQMYPLKALGPDSMPPLFYQYFWSHIGDRVTQTILDFLNHGVAPPKFNETHIVLIPKIKKPKRMTDYRPISLCNVVFKIASKVIC